MTKTMQELLQAVKACNDDGRLAHVPCRRTAGPHYGYMEDSYRKNDVKAWTTLVAFGKVVEVPRTSVGGGWATPESLLPGTALHNKLNASMCKRQAELEALIETSQAQLRVINSFLGNR